MPKRVLAFDYGKKRIGTAIGNLITQSTQPLSTLNTTASGAINWQEVSKIIDEWQPDYLVIGLALDQQGQETEFAKITRQFSKQLQDKFNKSVIFVNERYTSAEANYIIRQDKIAARTSSSVKNRRDSLAAELILKQHFNEIR